MQPRFQIHSWWLIKSLEFTIPLNSRSIMSKYLCMVYKSKKAAIFCSTFNISPFVAKQTRKKYVKISFAKNICVLFYVVKHLHYIFWHSNHSKGHQSNIDWLWCRDQSGWFRGICFNLRGISDRGRVSRRGYYWTIDFCLWILLIVLTKSIITKFF